MSVIKVNKLGKYYGTLNVLVDISFSLEKGDKVALVGNNGTGKTTLLRIIAGLEELDKGKLNITQGMKVGYLPQDINLTAEGDIRTYLRSEVGEDLQEHQMQSMLAGFGLSDISLDKKLDELSSGQKSKIVLTSILLKGSDILLLDEPTNNLDLPALIWLEDYLVKSDATCIIISHDRRFVDRVVKKIFEIDWDKHTLEISGGRYSDFLDRKIKELNRQKQEFHLQSEEKQRLWKRVRKKREAATLGAKWNPPDNDKILRGFKRGRAARSHKTAKAIVSRIGQMVKLSRPNERDPFDLDLEAEKREGVLDIRLKKVVAGYHDFRIGPIDMSIKYGNRIGIMGLNGAGKSTLLKTITGVLPTLDGSMDIGAGIKIGNMMQEHETLPRDVTPLKYITERGGIEEGEVYSRLTAFDFDERQVKKPISELSPGGRARLLLALFSAQSVNMLVLDEPTNHLDLEALEALEKTLKTYEGTVLIVSHDRYFLEQAELDNTFTLEDGKLIKIPDYEAYVEEAEKRAKKLLKST